MNKQSLYKLIVILGVLIIALFLVDLLSESNFKPSNLVENTSDINKVVIKNPKTNLNVEFSRIDNLWKISENYADENIISEFIFLLENTRITDVVSESESSLNLFELEERDAPRLEIYFSDTTKESFFVGKSSLLGGSYVRKSGSFSVYHLSKNLTSILGYTYWDLVSKNINNLELSNIESISVNSKKIDLLDPAKFETINKILKLNAIRVIGDVLDDTKPEETLNITIQLNDGSEYKQKAIFLHNDYFYQANGLFYQITSIQFEIFKQI